MKRIGLPIGAIMITVGLTLSACGGGISEGELADQLSEDGALTDDQADCVAKEVFDANLNDDQIEALGSDAENLEDTDLSDKEAAELLEVFTTAAAKCVTAG